MAISPITSVPILWQNSLVDIQPTSQYGRIFDRAVVTTNLLLQVAGEQDVAFLLPTIDAPESVPQLRVVSEDAEPSHEFSESTEQEVQELVADGVEADEAARKLWDAVKTEAREWRRTTVRVRAGDQLVRFTNRHKIQPTDDGAFELRVLAPLASFVLQAGGSISFAVGLPRIPGRSISIDHAVAENPPGTLLADISERPVLAQRMFVAHYWQNDPLYRIKYRYL